MDKNKSLNKLKGLPHILWLNLDRDTHRREYMESHFDYWNIENHTRISGYDAKEDDVSLHLKGRYPDLMTPNEVGCVLSHLKAIKYFYEETDHHRHHCKKQILYQHQQRLDLTFISDRYNEGNDFEDYDFL